MNFLSGSEDADGKKCFYCNKVFENHRALIGHLRVHQENGSSVDLNFPGQPSKFINVNRNHPVPPLNIQQNLAGANSPTSNARALPTIDFCTLFRSNKANQAGRKRSTGGSSSYLVPNGVCQFNTGEFQIIQDGLLPTSRDALKRTQGYTLGKFLNPTLAITNTDLGHLFVTFARSSSILRCGKRWSI
ncbi:Galactose oxidase/kelch repeat superfamily protein [Hibiscus syriacus]|uniref:Galactose oxidase/kelch repeat superfamily protein n=1 Tax=Hibiscus syriacus TaxID=106335 RepID=A0A6A3BX27_HIBSY|nr:Galactose oxidase/kelch repeat superfamily protein [Hibiscus syriacus]